MEYTSETVFVMSSQDDDTAAAQQLRAAMEAALKDRERLQAAFDAVLDGMVSWTYQ